MKGVKVPLTPILIRAGAEGEYDIAFDTESDASDLKSLCRSMVYASVTMVLTLTKAVHNKERVTPFFLT